MAGWLRRLRRRVGAFVGGFEAAGTQRRLSRFLPAREHVNGLIASTGPTVLARARWLVRNNGYAANAVESWAANVVGDGIHPVFPSFDPDRKAAVARLFDRWTDEADAEGVTDCQGLQRRIARELFVAGECFVRFRPRRPQDGVLVPLQLQVLPSEMVPVERNEARRNGNVIRCGIEFDRIGRRVAYWFYRRHPNDATDRQERAGEQVRVPASEVLHIMDPVEAGQIRGVSRFAPAIVRLFTLDQYDDAELERKKTAAMYALFVTTPSPETALADAAEDPEGERTIELRPGAIEFLEPGEDIKVSAPADVGQNYEAFQYRTLLQISAALGIPYAYLSNDMLKANYSNSRMALLEFRRRIEAFQWSVMVYQFCRPVIERWMDTAVLAGSLDLPDYAERRRDWLDIDWLPPRWDWVDPLKDARAEIEMIRAGLKSRTQAIAERGWDAEQVDAEIAADRERERRLGIGFDTSPIGGNADVGNAQE